MEAPLRILLVEDRDTDAELAIRLIAQEQPGCLFERVETRVDYEAALAAFAPTLIVTDFQLPTFDGLTALHIARERVPDTPVVIWTGSQNEDVAVACMRAGASNYVLKEDFKRLSMAVEQALAERRIRYEAQQAERARSESEERLRMALATARMGVWEWDLTTGNVFCTDEGLALLGVPDQQGPIDSIQSFIHPDDRPRVDAMLHEASANGQPYRSEFRIVRPDGTVRHVLSRGRVHTDEAGTPQRVLGTLLDVTERVEAEEEQRRARTLAEEANRMKTVFLANMSHEIRTPLTAIIGFAELLESELSGDYREFAELISKGGRRLMETLDSVLTLAQLEANRTELALQPMDVLAAVNDITALFVGEAQQRGLTLRVKAPTSSRDLMALLNRGGLSSILQNLMGNAIKFTEPGGAITVGVDVEADPAGDCVRIEVRDTGIGISEVYLPQLFEPYTQESSGMSRAYEGSGLGLSIARQLVLKMGGTIAVESRKGAGSCFTLRFPLLPVVPPAPSESADEPEAPPRRWRVLVVEDNLDVHHLLRRLLGAAYEVEGEADAEAGLLAAQTALTRWGSPYDVVLVDINLGRRPGGEDLLPLLRSIDGYEDVPIVAVTAYALPGDRDRFLNQGFTAYLSKPFVVKELRALLADVIAVTQGSRGEL